MAIRYEIKEVEKTEEKEVFPFFAKNIHSPLIIFVANGNDEYYSGTVVRPNNRYEMGNFQDDWSKMLFKKINIQTRNSKNGTEFLEIQEPKKELKPPFVIRHKEDGYLFLVKKINNDGCNDIFWGCVLCDKENETQFGFLKRRIDSEFELISSVTMINEVD